MRETIVEKQIQQVLSYVQRRLADIQKENILEDLEEGLLEYKTMGKFLVDIRKEFGRGDKELVKVAELKRLEQGGKTMEKFVQEFRRAARENRNERRPLVEEFKKEINITIHQRLIESEWPPSLIEQQYDRTIALDRNQRENKRKKERLREQWEQKQQAPKQNNGEAQQQQLPQPQVWPRRQEIP